jgi:rhodanese-related sulfurtransferase
MQQLSPKQLKNHLEISESQPVLLDVREPWEYDTCHLEGSLHIPMGEITRRLDELPNDQEIVVICHHGIRSMQVARYLMHNGFEKVINLSGGVDGWAREVDSDMPVY